MTGPIRPVGPMGPGHTGPGPAYPGPTYSGPAYTGPVGSLDLTAPDRQTGPVRFMAIRVLLAWALILLPIAYGIYMTLIALPPLFDN